MDQFKSSWIFTFANIKFFFVLALPVIAMESLTAHLIAPLVEMTQPEDIMEFFQNNAAVMFVLVIVGIIVQMAFLGGIWVSFVALDSNRDLNPISALQTGLAKFIPLFLGYIIYTIAMALGLLLLILPGIYIAARLSLFPAFIMLENKKTFESISSSWEATDEFGSKLFMFTLVFFSLSLVTGLILTSILPANIFQLVIVACAEYMFVIPLGYIYFTLYKTVKSN